MGEVTHLPPRAASSLGERLFTALGDAGASSYRAFRECPPARQAMYERAAVSFVASLTYAESEGVREALLSSVLLGLLQEWAAIDAGSWHPVRHASEKADLLDRTKAAIRQAKEAA